MIDSLYSSFAFLALNLCPLIVGSRLAGHFYPKLSGAVRICLNICFAFSFVILVFLLCASFKLFVLPVVLVICLLSAFFALRFLKYDSHSLDPRSFFDSLSTITKCISFVAALVFFWELTRALLIQPLAWDSMTYHLFFAARWVQEGGLTLFSIPGGVDGYSHFPINGEIMAAWYLLPFHSDIAANITNFPAWILGIFAVYALARECELSSDFSVLASLLVCFSPMLFELLPTSYVDILVFSSLISATLFFLKYERTAELKYTIAAGLACGIAIGTKLSALYYILILLVFVLLKSVFFFREKRISLASLLSALAIAIFLAGSVGAYQYFANFLETGNPLYPFAFGSFEASAYKQKVIDEIAGEFARAKIEVGFFSGFLRAFEVEGKANFWAGNRKFFLFLLLSIFSLYSLRRAKERFKICALLILGFLPVYLIFAGESPDVVTTRTVWPHLSARLMASSLVVLTILAIKIVSRSFLAKVFQVFFAALILVDLSNIVWTQSHLFNVIIIYFELLILCAIGCKAVFVNGSRSFFLATRALGGLVSPMLLLSFMTFHLEYFRSKTQGEYYSSYKDEFAMPISFRHGWHWLLAQPGSKTIAFATGWWQYGHNWFLFPLLGRNFENQVVYASINRTDDLPTSADNGLLRETADKQIWLENLMAKNVDYLYLQTPETHEHVWVKEEPGMFVEVFSDKVAKIYRVNWRKRVSVQPLGEDH